MVHLHQLSDAGGFGVELAPEAICLHDGFIVGLVRFTQFRRHGHFVVEIGKAAIGVQGAGIENRLSGLLNLGLLLLGGCWPREVVIDNIYRISVIALDSSAYSS